MPATKPIIDRIAKLKAQKEKLGSRLNALEAKAKQEDKRRDVHRKIVVGAAVLDHIAKSPKFASQLAILLDQAVKRPADRDVVADLLAMIDKTA